ncbi:MAG: hypothetical protein K2X93_19065 [Candidatus Obscuribacterales bacterium]|nr:hypothetical protein [Candidatus Obscuribacterales bacterium]
MSNVALEQPTIVFHKEHRMSLSVAMVLLLTACSALLSGLALMEISRRGPRTYLTVGILLTIVTAGIGVGASRLFVSPDGDCVPLLQAASLGVGFGLLPMCIGWVVIPRRKAYLTDIAPQIKRFALRRFQDLDRDGDGVITHNDLALLKDVKFNPTERRLLQELDWLLGDIGHVIEVVPTSTYSSCSGFPVWTTGTEYINIYGVNREDLEKYPTVIKDRYINW